MSDGRRFISGNNSCKNKKIQQLDSMINNSTKTKNLLLGPNGVDKTILIHLKHDHRALRAKQL